MPVHLGGRVGFPVGKGKLQGRDFNGTVEDLRAELAATVGFETVEVKKEIEEGVVFQVKVVKRHIDDYVEASHRAGHG